MDTRMPLRGKLIIAIGVALLVGAGLLAALYLPPWWLFGGWTAAVVALARSTPRIVATPPAGAPE